MEVLQGLVAPSLLQRLSRREVVSLMAAQLGEGSLVCDAAEVGSLASGQEVAAAPLPPTEGKLSVPPLANSGSLPRGGSSAVSTPSGGTDSGPAMQHQTGVPAADDVSTTDREEDAGSPAFGGLAGPGAAGCRGDSSEAPATCGGSAEGHGGMEEPHHSRGWSPCALAVARSRARPGEAQWGAASVAEKPRPSSSGDGRRSGLHRCLRSLGVAAAAEGHEGCMRRDSEDDDPESATGPGKAADAGRLAAAGLQERHPMRLGAPRAQGSRHALPGEPLALAARAARSLRQ